MATMNPFDLLGDDAEDPSQLIVAEQLKAAAAPPKEQAKQRGGGGGGQSQPNKPAQLPSKPAPPAQAVREARNERGGRGGGQRGGRGFALARAGRGFNRDFNDDNSFPASEAPDNRAPFEGDAEKSGERRGYGGPRGPYRGGGGGGGRRGGFSNGEAGEEGRPRRTFERRSGTGRGSEFKREGAGRGNWGTEKDEIAEVTEEAVNETEKPLGDEKPAVEDGIADANKESPANEAEEKEPEDKEMTLEEYEKVLEEKRKALQALKTDAAARKVDTTDFETMKAISSKKENNEIFAKLGSDKDKRKEAYEKEEKAKKSLSINEFLKPAEGETYYGGRGRGGRGGRGPRGGGGGGNYRGNNAPAPSIEDTGHFPTLGAK